MNVYIHLCMHKRVLQGTFLKQIIGSLLCPLLYCSHHLDLQSFNYIPCILFLRSVYAKHPNFDSNNPCANRMLCSSYTDQDPVDVRAAL